MRQLQSQKREDERIWFNLYKFLTPKMLAGFAKS